MNLKEKISGCFEHIRQLTDSSLDIQHHPLFCEMLELCSAISPWESVYFWSETARWIKFEETVEEGGNRWSRPHITLISLPSLIQLRHCLRKGTTILDANFVDFKGVSSLFEILFFHFYFHSFFCFYSGALMRIWQEKHNLQEMDMDLLQSVLSSPKFHYSKTPLKKRLTSTVDLMLDGGFDDLEVLSKQASQKMKPVFYVFLSIFSFENKSTVITNEIKSKSHVT